VSDIGCQRRVKSAFAVNRSLRGGDNDAERPLHFRDPVARSKREQVWTQSRTNLAPLATTVRSIFMSLRSFARGSFDISSQVGLRDETVLRELQDAIIIRGERDCPLKL